jgi:UDP-N-acetylglucosamine 3-dehydrogenase
MDINSFKGISAKMKVGVIGVGDWGKNHLRVYSELDCDLIGFADSNPERECLAKEYKIRFFSDYKDLLPLVDAVSIVVPTDHHYDIVKDCLENGKHVLVEKPITLDHKSSEELLNIAKKKNLILAVGYLFRFNAAVKVLKEEIKKIGDLQYITARYIHSNKPPRKDCGVIFNFGVHLVDILNFVLDEKPKRVYCKKINYLSDKYEDAAIMDIDYGNFIANLEMSWFHPLKKRDLWVIGSKAKIYADLFEQIIVKYPIQIDRDGIKKSAEMNLEVNKNEPLKEELRSFCEAVDSNHHEKFEGKEEITTTKICELALKSSIEKRELDL